MNFGMFVHICMYVHVCVCVCVMYMYVRTLYVCIILLSITLASGRLPILLKTGSIMHMKPRQRQLANREGTV